MSYTNAVPQQQLGGDYSVSRAQPYARDWRSGECAICAVGLLLCSYFLLCVGDSVRDSELRALLARTNSRERFLSFSVRSHVATAWGMECISYKELRSMWEEVQSGLHFGEEFTDKVNKLLQSSPEVVSE